MMQPAEDSKQTNNNRRAVLPGLQEFRLLAEIQQPECNRGEECQASVEHASDPEEIPPRHQTRKFTQFTF